MNKSFLGTGWAFPPTFVKEGKNGILTATDVDDINQSLEILLSTALGERILRPDYGADLTRLLFEPLNTTLIAFVRDLLTRAILINEPRIVVDRIDLEAEAEEGRLLIFIDYIIPAVNSRYNIVYPFYLNEATEI